jgi:hypothetical protein
MKEISRNDFVFFKYRNYVRGGHCDHSPQAPKYLAMPPAMNKQSQLFAFIVAIL